MNKENTLRYIAELAYNVGFGAKRHFASHDIVDKLPGIIGFLSLSVGVFALTVPWLSTQHMSALLISLGILSLYVSFAGPDKERYATTGEELTKIFGELKQHYFEVKQIESENTDVTMVKIKEIEGRYYDASISKQLLLSDWLAHYKFFWQHQIGWVDEQLNFRFFRDKVPLSVTLIFSALVVAFIVWGTSCLLNYEEICANILNS